MKKRRILLALSLVLLAGAAYVLGWSTLFTVSAVEIKGTDTILPTGVIKGEKLARVEPRVVAGSLGKYDWIKSASVSRNWVTGKISITIVERTPIAIYNNMAIDASGKSFINRQRNISSLPKIQAPSVGSAIIAAAFFGQLPTDISAHVKLLKVGSGDTFIMEVATETGTLELRWGRSDENALKAAVYKALLQQQENKKLKRVDVSAPHAPIVK